jgi:5'-3' exonuclease
MKALIDGDIVVYRSAFAAEHTIYTLHDTHGSDDPSKATVIGKFESAKAYKEYVADNELTSYAVSREREVEPVENVLYSIKHTIKSICKELNTKDYAVYLSKGECYRHKMASLSKYKGNRDDTPRPVHYAAAREYLLKYFDAEVFESIEADDALALYQTEDTCICSIDKDLLQIEGRHYNWVKGEKSLVKPRAALCRLWEQVLTGDGTDNIPGIKGMGPATAKKLIAKCKGALEMEHLCIKEWDKALKAGKVQKIDLQAYRKGMVHYTNPNGNPSIKTVRDVVKEVHMLVKVGGKLAQEKLDEGANPTKEGS